MHNPTRPDQVKQKGNTMSQSIWDSPELATGGEFVSFTAVGDTVSGTVTAVRAHRFDDGKVVPQILLTTDDGEEKTLTAGAIRLKIAVAEQRPDSGDHIKVTLTQEEKRPGGKTLRHWDVIVTKAGSATPTPTPAPVAAATPVAEAPAAQADPAAVAAALGNLTPEQKAALGL